MMQNFIEHLTQHEQSQLALLHRLGQLSATHELVLIDHVTDEQGQCLLAKGKTLTPQLCAGLEGRALGNPIERCVQVRAGVYGALRDRARAYLDENELMQRLFTDTRSRELVIDGVGDVPLSPSLELLLSCHNATQPGTLDHHLRVAALCCWFGPHLRMSDNMLRMAMAAALFHDVGEVYIHPEHLGRSASGDVSLESWIRVVLHPIMGQDALQRFGVYPQEVSRAVLEHHERNNGSGYPNHVTQISPLGQALSMAELLSGVLSASNHPGRRASVALHFERDEFNGHFIAALGPLLLALDGREQKTLQGEPRVLIDFLHALAQQIEHGAELLQAIPFHAATHTIQLMTQDRIKRLLTTLYATGLTDADMFSASMFDAQNLSLLLELDMTVREISWRVRYVARSLALEIRHMAPEYKNLFQPFLKQINTLPQR